MTKKESRIDFNEMLAQTETEVMIMTRGDDGVDGDDGNDGVDGPVLYRHLRYGLVVEG